jgi:hypothetical protein
MHPLFFPCSLPIPFLLSHENITFVTVKESVATSFFHTKWSRGQSHGIKELNFEFCDGTSVFYPQQETGSRHITDSWDLQNDKLWKNHQHNTILLRMF